MNAATWMAWGAMAGGVGMYGWIWQKAGKSGRRWMEWGVAALVAGVSLASVLTHEPWRDELHSWLQAREMGLGPLWMEMACEGHFIPWYLLLWPLAHSGAPVWTMGMVSWGLNAAAVWWLARRSPLSGWEKAVAGVSCLFLYVNPVVSRCYVLVPLALWGVASLWKRRDERPVAFGLWVALLANTHVYMEGTAVALSGVFAWENVLRRKDGKAWRECRRHWAGLAVMAAGGVMAAAQVVPGLWTSSVGLGQGFGWREETRCFLSACHSPVGMLAVAAGLAGMGVLAWRNDRGVFWMWAAGVGYMWGFAVFLYSAFVVNRSLLWWPVALAAAWMLAERGAGGRGRVLAVTLMGLGLLRPDMTWRDWREDYDVLPRVCREINEHFGKGTEVWISCASEVAAVYLENAMDWTTGEKARPFSWNVDKGLRGCPFRSGREEIFRKNPMLECFLAMGTMAGWGWMTMEDTQSPGVEILRVADHSINPDVGGVVVLRAWRWGREWAPVGMARYQAGDRPGAVQAWKRAVEEDGGAWEAMNNLAWLCAEDGRVAEARAWMDCAMEQEAARESAGAWNTEAAVRRAEGDEKGAKAAEMRRDELRARTQ